MKAILNKLVNITSVLVLALSLFACKDDVEQTIVDLRYNPEDSYTLMATSPEPIKFEVRSNHPWEIINKGTWNVVTPEVGLSDSIYLVTVVCEENTELDDRIDTLIIKSDYWVGKRVELLQKGTAYLRPVQDTIVIESALSSGQVALESNQDWSIKVTSGESWLTLTSEAEGSENGNISFETTENNGELRYGIITLYDRNDKASDTLVVSQNGVLLNVSETEIRAIYSEPLITFNVESNSRWELVKSEYDIWYEIEGEVVNEGNKLVTIALKENSGISIRKSEIIIRSVSDEEGVAPVERSLVLKQAYQPKIEIKEFDGLFAGGAINSGEPIFADGDMLIGDGQNRLLFGDINSFTTRIGTHYFRIKEMSPSSYPIIFFVFNWGPELRSHIKASEGKTDASYAGKDLLFESGDNIPIDINTPHTLGISVSDAGGEFAGKAKVELSLDYNLPYKTYIIDASSSGSIQLYIGGSPGVCVWDWYGYTTNLDWNN